MTTMAKKPPKTITTNQRLSPLWAPFHEYAWFFPSPPSPNQETNAIQMYTKLFPELIFCDACKKHYTEMVNKTPPNTASRDTLFKWTVDRHNEVNLRLGKPIHEYSEVYAAYESGALPIVGRPNESSGTNSSSNVSGDDNDDDDDDDGNSIGGSGHSSRYLDVENWKSMGEEAFANFSFKDRVMWMVAILIIIVLIMRKIVSRIANFIVTCPIQ